MLCFFAGAIYSSSIAIGTDVMHLASDLLSFMISLIAVYLAKKQPTSRLAWGYYRAGLYNLIAYSLFSRPIFVFHARLLQLIESTT